MYANRRNLRVLKDIGVVEHDGDVRFFTGSGNTAVSRMRNASNHHYWNRSFIMDVAMGQIPRSTERISSCDQIYPDALRSIDTCFSLCRSILPTSFTRRRKTIVVMFIDKDSTFWRADVFDIFIYLTKLHMIWQCFCYRHVAETLQISYTCIVVMWRGSYKQRMNYAVTPSYPRDLFNLRLIFPTVTCGIAASTSVHFLRHQS